MDNEFNLARLNNLVLKTKIVIGFFIGVLLLQVAGITALSEAQEMGETPFSQLVLIPAFILLVIIDEYFILRHIRKAIKGNKKISLMMMYIISFMEISYPSLVLYFGSNLLEANNAAITPFMFTNSPPFIIYFIFLVLSCFYLDFKLSVFIGTVAALEYSLVNFLVIDVDDMEFAINISKSIFLIITGIIAGFVSRKLQASVISSLESKNILIHELDAKVAERTKEVETQSEKLAQQNIVLQARNREIIDSINYAKRLQKAILPSASLVKKNLPQSFILYKPKDIVAGDFYWMESVNDTIYFAAADCTGHGVPGAMVSVVCSNELSRALIEERIYDPGKLLDRTRELVIEHFGKGDEEIKDGMDIALVSLGQSENGERTLQYAGANNPLWIVRNGAEEVEEIKADKQPIGKYAAEKPFTTHSIKLQKGDSIYIFSDGYADQFGGDKGKKYKSSQLKKLLLSIVNNPMDQQLEKLNSTFEIWKKDLEQTDDVCIIGVRI